LQKALLQGPAGHKQADRITEMRRERGAHLSLIACGGSFAVLIDPAGTLVADDNDFWLATK
jgi:hypothetical protein